MSEWASPAAIACDCGGDTTVVNTRGRSNRAVIHRQRRCTQCRVVFSTFESRLNPEDAKRVEAALERLEGAIVALWKLVAEIKR